MTILYLYTVVHIEMVYYVLHSTYYLYDMCASKLNNKLQKLLLTAGNDFPELM